MSRILISDKSEYDYEPVVNNVTNNKDEIIDWLGVGSVKAQLLSFMKRRITTIMDGPSSSARHSVSSSEE